MNVVALISPAGGAGRTTLTAALAALLARDGRPTVALDLDSQNTLAAHFGLDRLPERGLGHALLEGGAPWHTHTYRSSDGVLFVPYGALDAAQCGACDARLAAHPDWLAGALTDIRLPHDGVVLLDTARYPSPQAEQALRCASLVLCVIPPEPAACAAVAARLYQLRRPHAVFHLVVNRVNPARAMHRDALLLLRALAGQGAVLDQRIHLDAGLPEALARGAWVFDEAPGSQVSHDLHGLANWLARWLGARLSTGGCHGAAQA